MVFYLHRRHHDVTSETAAVVAVEPVDEVAVVSEVRNADTGGGCGTSDCVGIAPAADN